MIILPGITSLLTKSTTFILGDISNVFGIIINAIYNFFNNTMNIQSLGVTIIVFTLLVRVLMLPLAIKQQKSMQETQRIQPELKKIQDKYKNQKDPDSQKKYQEEMQKLYQEHGVSPFGGCLPLIIQMPIIFALFAVLRNIPAYIGSVKEAYLGIYNGILSVPGFEEKITVLNDSNLQAERISPLVQNFDVTVSDSVVDLLAAFTSEHWIAFKESFSAVIHLVEANIEQIQAINTFITINLAEKPDLFSIGVLIPILCVLAQIGVTKTTSAGKEKKQVDQTQKTMTYMMPVITVFFVMQMPAGLGLYWLASNVFQFVQQVVINKYLLSHPKK